MLAELRRARPNGIADAATPNEGGSTPGIDAAPDSSTSGDSGDAVAEVTRGLLLHYRFDEPSGDAIVDSAPNANSGKLVNGDAGSPLRVAGKHGGALSFAGGTYAETPYHPTMAVDRPFTVSLWIEAPADAGVQPRILVHGDVYELKLNGRNIQISGGGGYTIATYELPPDRWTHFAVVVGTTDVKWFVDGLELPRGTDTYDGGAPSFGTSTKPFRIASGQFFVNPFTGKVDDVRVYSVALTPQEIATLAK